MEICINNRDHLDDFIRLNEEWITAHFSLEEADRVLARDPGAIIDQAGYVFSLVERGEVVGVCALFNAGDAVYELARMAVSPSEQGKGYGKMLMEACMEKLEEIGARKVFLVSNTKLQPAVAMYRRFGFVPTGAQAHADYARANIVMERLLPRGDEGRNRR